MSKPVTFIQAPVLGSAAQGNSGDSGHSHSHDHAHAHDHDHGHNRAHDHGAQEHGHSHEVMEHPGQYFDCRRSRKAPLARSRAAHDELTRAWSREWETTGKFAERDLPDYSGRDWKERGFTIGIGGPVGSGKTALTLALCRIFRDTHNIAVVTNDIFTKEDQEFLIRNEALADKGRIRAIETGGCPHAAIREDISANIGALEGLQADYGCDMLFVESGGDNLAANYSRELADYIDVSGGDKIPRKGGPGISQSDLLIVNKIDLAPYVGASLEVMKRDADKMRDHGPTLFTSVKLGQGVDGVVELINGAWKAATGGHNA